MFTVRLILPDAIRDLALPVRTGRRPRGKRPHPRIARDTFQSAARARIGGDDTDLVRQCIRENFRVGRPRQISLDAPVLPEVRPRWGVLSPAPRKAANVGYLHDGTRGRRPAGPRAHRPG